MGGITEESFDDQIRSSVYGRQYMYERYHQDDVHETATWRTRTGDPTMCESLATAQGDQSFEHFVG